MPSIPLNATYYRNGVNASNFTPVLGSESYEQHAYNSYTSPLSPERCADIDGNLEKYMKVEAAFSLSDFSSPYVQKNATYKGTHPDIPLGYFDVESNGVLQVVDSFTQDLIRRDDCCVLSDGTFTDLSDKGTLRTNSSLSAATKRMFFYLYFILKNTALFTPQEISTASAIWFNQIERVFILQPDTNLFVRARIENVQLNMELQNFLKQLFKVSSDKIRSMRAASNGASFSLEQEMSAINQSLSDNVNMFVQSAKTFINSPGNDTFDMEQFFRTVDIKVSVNIKVHLTNDNERAEARYNVINTDYNRDILNVVSLYALSSPNFSPHSLFFIMFHHFGFNCEALRSQNTSASKPLQQYFLARRNAERHSGERPERRNIKFVANAPFLLCRVLQKTEIDLENYSNYTQHYGTLKPREIQLGEHTVLTFLDSGSVYRNTNGGLFGEGLVNILSMTSLTDPTQDNFTVLVPNQGLPLDFGLGISDMFREISFVFLYKTELYADSSRGSQTTPAIRTIEKSKKRMNESTFNNSGELCPYSHKTTNYKVAFKMTEDEERLFKNSSVASPIFLGLELEAVVRRDTLFNRFVKEMADSPFGDHMIAKSDSSTGANGLEIVTIPATLKYHKQYLDKHFFGAPHKFNKKMVATPSCGIHVHISKRAFCSPKSKSLALGKFISFTNSPRNAKFMEEMANRPPNQYCRKLDILKPSSRNKLDNSASRAFQVSMNTENRHMPRGAVNCIPAQTIEVRIFKSSLERNNVFRKLEFCESLVRFCKEKSMQEMTVYHFVEFILQKENKREYPCLLRWLASQGYVEHEKKLIKNSSRIVDIYSKNKLKPPKKEVSVYTPPPSSVVQGAKKMKPFKRPSPVATPVSTSNTTI